MSHDGESVVEYVPLSKALRDTVDLLQRGVTLGTIGRKHMTWIPDQLVHISKRGEERLRPITKFAGDHVGVRGSSGTEYLIPIDALHPDRGRWRAPSAPPPDPQPAPPPEKLEPRIIEYLSEEAWLADRNFISASILAQVVGLSQWGAKLSAYVSITEPPDSQDSPAMEAGRALEEGIARWACERHGLDEPTMNGRRVYVHPEHDFIRCTPDVFTGGDWGLEVKTTSWTDYPELPHGELGVIDMSSGGRVDGKPFPADALCQSLLCMEITGARVWYIAVGVLRWGCELRVYRLERSPGEQQWLIDEAAKFWREHIEARIAPAAVEADRFPMEKLRKIADREAPAGGEVYLDEDKIQRAAREWVDMHNTAKDCYAARDLYAARIAQAMGSADTAWICGNKFSWRVDYRTGKRVFRGPRNWKEDN